jgi:parallel beta-helix repeat protein
MTRSVLSAYGQRSIFKNALIVPLALACMLAGLRPSAAATNFTIGQTSFSPTTVAIGGSFALGFNLNAAIVLSNAIVAMEICDSSGNKLLENDVVGQNFQPGQTVSYSWNGTIAGPSLSVPFVSGHYKMVVIVFNSNRSAVFMPGTLVATFTVPWGSPAPSPIAGNPLPPPAQPVAGGSPAAPPNLGYTAAPPIPPPAGTGKTYYVSSPANPAVDQANRALLSAGATVYPTIQAAANVTQPGDTVLVMNGTYEPGNPNQWVNAVVTLNTSGSAAGGYITYAAYPGDHPVVTSSNTVNTWDVFQIFGSYIVVRGFEVIGSAQNVTLAYASQAAAAETATLQQEAAAALPATYPSSAAKDVTNGNCIAGQNLTHVIITNNLIHDCSASGIDFETSDYVTVEANTVYNTSWWTVYGSSGIDLHYALNSDSSAAYKNFVLDNIAYNNANTQPFMYDLYSNFVKPGSALTAPTDGEGIIIDTNQVSNNGSPYLGRTLVAGNITYNNGGAGIEVYRSSHVDTINNTAYMNDTCVVVGSSCGPAATATQAGGINNGQVYSNSGNDNNIYNNILYAPAGKYVYTNWGNSSTVENDNILYSANGQILTNNYKPAAQDKTVNPLFSNSAAPATNEFVFAANAPGINAGISYNNDNVSVPALLGLTVVNGAVNIGADQ